MLEILKIWWLVVRCMAGRHKKWIYQFWVKEVSLTGKDESKAQNYSQVQLDRVFRFFLKQAIKRAILRSIGRNA